MSTCKNCRWWNSQIGRAGDCLRFPPVPVYANNEIKGHWPITRADATCGEFSKRSAFRRKTTIKPERTT